MRTILLIGAGRSSSFLIKYLLDHAYSGNWSLVIGDLSEETAREKVGTHPAGHAIRFDIQDEKQRALEIQNAELIISLLPAHMHMPVALECVRQQKNMVTASYVSKEMQELDHAAKDAGIILLNECGLDPGIDHMSAMQIMDEIRASKGLLTSFRSFTGGLVAPESNDNPWGYKFSWNPRNVILAGQGTASYIEDGNYKYIPYNRLFAFAENIHVSGSGDYDGYANRDSLSYRKFYGLENIPTMLRGTLRNSGFCKAWNVFVQLGLTDDNFIVENSGNLTHAQLVEAFLPAKSSKGTLRKRVADFMNEEENGEVMKKISWTGILDDSPVNLKDATPARILQQLLEQKWKLKDTDKDMIVMQHEFGYQLDGVDYLRTSSLVTKGEDSVYTAMAKTVGLPLAIAAKFIMNGKIKSPGVQIPVLKEIYDPVLKELKNYEIFFKENVNARPGGR